MNHGAEGESVSPGGGHVLHVYTRITVSYPTAPKLQRLRTASLAHRAYGFLFSPFTLYERFPLANTFLSLSASSSMASRSLVRFLRNNTSLPSEKEKQIFTRKP